MSKHHQARYLLQKALYYMVPKPLLAKMYYRAALHKKLNLKNPQSYNEKLNWLKLYEYPNNPLIIQCADKYAVREYIEEKGYGELLNDLIGVWDDVEDIPWDNLPEKFALKGTHGCAYNIICDKKANLNIEDAKKQLRKWMKEKYGCLLVEPHYNKIKPRIVCEKYLEGDLLDYKFFCFNGKVEMVSVISRKEKNKPCCMTFFNRSQEILPIETYKHPIYSEAKLPARFSEMLEIAENISNDFDFVRVDLYEYENKILFGELTFTPTAGLMRYKSNADDELGKKLIINK